MKISSSSEDEFQPAKPTSRKKAKSEQVNGKKSTKKPSKEISSSEDSEDDMRNVKKSNAKKKGAAKKKKGVIFDSGKYFIKVQSHSVNRLFYFGAAQGN